MEGEEEKMDYLIRLVQMHEDFRLAEIRALASFFSIGFDVIIYSTESPFLVVRILSYPVSRFASERAVLEALASRSVLVMAIYELWGVSMNTEADEVKQASYAALHADVRLKTGQGPRWTRYRDCSFKFSIDTYCGKRSPEEQVEIINSFRYLGFQGPIRMKNPDAEFTVFEEWSLEESPHHRVKIKATCEREGAGLDSSPDLHDATKAIAIPSPARSPRYLFLGRLVCSSARATLNQKHSLKTRPYISTTSMDATLALITANIAQAGPGKLVYDPFVGTGGFVVAAAEFGAYVWGSDIDGRSFRGTRAKAGGRSGKGCAEGIDKNFKAYGLQDHFLDCFISDITNSPLRCSDYHSLPTTIANTVKDSAASGFLDAIICDPPYGVREGLKVLGNREYRPDRAILMIDGVPAHTLPGYVAPRKQYSFERMLDDILAFAADMLVVDGMLAFWTPSTHNDDSGDGDKNDTVLRIPRHGALELVECCVQDFRNWSRRLLVYRRRAVPEGDTGLMNATERSFGEPTSAKTASDLNPFRRKYFEGFQT